MVGAYYDGLVKELILSLKFHHSRTVARELAGLIVDQVDCERQYDLVTSVPVSAGRYRERGYNQSELLAREVARGLRLPYSSLLGRVNSVHQMGLGREERLAQIKGAFYPLRRLSGQRVLVVDDVLTTGATLSECASVLRESGAGPVWGAVIARH